MLLLPSCQTTKASSDFCQVQYVVPAIDFPPFPELYGAEETSDGDVNVPKEWILSLADYKIRIEQAQKLYNDLLIIYEERQVAEKSERAESENNETKAKYHKRE